MRLSEKAGQETGKLPHRFEPLYEAVSIGINLVEVAESHVLLFGRVKDFVNGAPPDAQVNLPELEHDCGLARWLKGIGASRYSHLSSFGLLREAHVEFHRQAIEVIGKIHSGSWVAAEQMRKNELAGALRRLLIALAELNDSINKPAWNIN